jgi:periplasmic divalent cation tolerance protein
MNDKPIFVYATFPDQNSAEMVGEILVDRGLVACVNLLPGAISIYIWEGKRQRDSEVVMIAKSRRGQFDTLVRTIKEHHPYTTPAIVALDIAAGSADYLRWIGEQTAERTLS